MEYWEQKPRFEIKEDGTIVSRMGTQTNCGGIASIRVRLARTTGTGITFCACSGSIPALGTQRRIPLRVD